MSGAAGVTVVRAATRTGLLGPVAAAGPRAVVQVRSVPADRRRDDEEGTA
ncbi:hypothetical protein ACFXOM_26305 [Streptomyces sp. NPDC059169]